MSCNKLYNNLTEIPPLKIGITGGIGSGKTIIAKILIILGVPVFFADVEAKLLMETNTSVVDSIKYHFGYKVYDNGILNRKKLADIIFANTEKLKLINSIVHPAVQDAFFKWSSLQNARFVGEESAILFESGLFAQLDFNILVTAPQEVCIKRVMERDVISKAQVLQRMNNQWPYNESIKRANAIIVNDGRHAVVPQVVEILNQLKSF